ncbi:MAG TPA: quinolinate synthase NadA [Vicinamibacteria bacterium]|nr:quinolinate synthase NadA [Vicinamibacteria bacterium]
MAQVALPEIVTDADAAEIQDRILEARKALGRRLVILGHHYQRDEVIRHADFTGDSFKLAQLAATRPEAEFIVFCGVHFMAESADILSAPHQKVVLPDLDAGCTMADMAETDQVEECWDLVTEVVGDDVLPITYMNSTAALKAFVGKRGGAVCTSSNARAILDWAFQQRTRVLFFPDQHLGRNTGFRMGIPSERMQVWDPYQDRGGLGDDQVRDARILLWKGHCSVHNRFTPAMVDRRREQMPGVKVIVHPECRFEVAQKADAIGSTEGIIKAIHESPAGTRWAVGTELNLVNRLARECAPTREVVSLDDCFCVCSTMFRIDPPHLLWALENLRDGRLVNVVAVPERIAADARVALDRMLAIS